jgi:hypothetical protein
LATAAVVLTAGCTSTALIEQPHAAAPSSSTIKPISFPSQLGDVAPATTAPTIAQPTSPAPPVGDPAPAPGPAPAPTPQAAPPEALASVSVSDEVLARISYPWRYKLPGWHLEFKSGRRGYQGLTFTYEKRIEIYMRQGASIDELVHVTAHEIAHAIDVQHFNDGHRSLIRSLRGYSQTVGWWPGNGANDMGSGAGDWAETFAYWQAGPSGGWSSQLSGPPSAGQLAALSAFLP